jgi:branched-chain amino acid transport system substrate-binding protein
MSRSPIDIRRRKALLAGLAAGASGFVPTRFASAAEAPITCGVSGPFSGDRAAYGAVWKKGMDMAVAEINGAGGIKGRPIELVYQDTQSDPKQSVPVAQKFVDDARIVAELGDFSSAASMAASPIYERGKLVQFGFTNSDPKFTKGGEYMWSTAPTMQMDAALMANIALKQLAGKRAAVFYQASDWGDTSQKVFVESYKAQGGNVAALENYLLNDKDYHSILAKARQANPDVLVLFSYYTDGALLLQQAQDVGLKGRILAATSCYSNKFLELGGSAVDGTVMSVLFFPADPRPAIQKFVADYKARYGGETPDQYGARAYDAVKIVAWGAEHGGATREGIRKAFLSGATIPSLLFGSFKFNDERRVAHYDEALITVKDSKFTYYT